ncbi:hypothetical protein AB1283_26110 [Bacillus sp. S13(2024)]|uniref:hypothetical protein n=1 Tax=Bacillus sp. S13(2024) TaxID=3162885 RepID=UPI003D1BB704
MVEEISKKQGDIQKAGLLFKKRKDYEKKIEEQEVIKDRYFDLYAMGRIKTEDELDKKLSPVEEIIRNTKIEIELLDEELKYITSGHDQIEIIRKRANEYKALVQSENLSQEYKRDIVNIFVRKVVLYENQIGLETVWDTSESTLERIKELVKSG